jgi:hypothetical protein
LGFGARPAGAVVELVPPGFLAVLLPPALVVGAGALGVAVLAAVLTPPQPASASAHARAASGCCLRKWGLPAQLHFDLLASTKLWKELTTVVAALVTVAILLAEGFVLSSLTALVRESTEDLIALVSLGKSFLASLTTVLASALIFVKAVCRVPSPLVGLKLVTSLIEFSRLVRAEQ